MNEIVHKCLLAADTYMPEMHSRQPGSTANVPGLTYSACGLFTKNKKRIQNLKKKKILYIL